MAEIFGTNDKILQVAKKLFAEKGYKSVTTREIADQLGINISTFHYHTGGKGNLYKSVIESLYEIEHRALYEPIKEFDPKNFGDRAKVKSAIIMGLQAFVQEMLKDPNRAHLYVRRWLEWPDEFMDYEVKLTIEIFRPFEEFLEEAANHGSVRGIDVSIFLRSFLWMVYGYFITGIIDWKKWVSDPLKKKNLEAFQIYLDDFIESMLFRDNSNRAIIAKKKPRNKLIRK
ncbi:TetR/AcrR family transcriptional regulator [Leptospira sp. GIMC2001]|uniref:TetR/AcrR family transcriptional regulator n=1 Tax=Leptospira sp. GIMC2001 TaxID=1513297 RepID=UPI00234B9B6E|nr:TetR/AcrR family transcriptional regulator [Leptospira sp. GIMC2001]WCL49464.1 TetR/AcrR family transcriptional regulator [Leptospira sp. GIMC2001]